MEPDDPAHAGQREYTPAFLRMYDRLVLGFFARFMWRCPSARLIEHYDHHIRSRHLDIGPGTGYFLERSRPPEHLTLLDPNPNVLAHASHRLESLRPVTVEADVCKPLPLEQRFDSVALNYVLHCLPGPQATKAAAVRHVAQVLESDGVLFGATVLGTPELHTWLSSAPLRSNNKRGIFDNLDDTEDGLAEILDRSFLQTSVETVGSVAVFAAHRPRRA